MRIAYLVNEKEGAASVMKCERFYIDTDKTDKQELYFLLNKGGIVAGDTVCVRQVSDFGRGKLGLRIAAQIEAQGATIEYFPTKAKRESRGRPSDLVVTDEHRAQMAIVWYESVYGLTRTLERLSEICGQHVTKSKAYTLFGPRDGSRKPENKLDKKEPDA